MSGALERDGSDGDDSRDLMRPRPMARGRFITVEGIDGAGKTTHIDALARLWRGRGREVVLTREPGGTPLAETLRGLVLHQPMDPLTEALLVFGARRDHVRGVISPALAMGKDVICDRFADASFAYQGGGNGCPWSVLEQLEAWVVGDVQPDLTLLFDLPAAEAARRRAAARQPDRFEAQDETFFERVRGAYLRRVDAQPGRFALIRADVPPDEVWAQVQRAVDERIPT
jgi:dTMP kinase